MVPPNLRGELWNQRSLGSLLVLVRFRARLLAGPGLPGLEELDFHLGPVDADKFAAAIGKAGRRQEQKELLEIETLDGTFHGQHGVIVRDGIEKAIATPGSVDAHDADFLAST